ncbi:hypothetical protein [Candidatus Cardinium hertigii]|uniref:hypothetical protein n=1 Tax=Candidatus Cardinium hertigii TaxID=247481 RepID=UPI0013A53387|nr:hypothetical protein [Candidatus Cardinium hertigii]
MLPCSSLLRYMLALSLPREAGTQEEASITPQEKTASLAQLSDFHDWMRSFRHCACFSYFLIGFIPVNIVYLTLG